MDEPAVFVSAVRFDGASVAIDYFEHLKQTTIAAIGETIMIDATQIEDAVQELQEFLVELVDRGQVMIRNPPKKIGLGKKLIEDSLKDAPEPDEDEDDE